MNESPYEERRQSWNEDRTYRDRDEARHHSFETETRL